MEKALQELQVVIQFRTQQLQQAMDSSQHNTPSMIDWDTKDVENNSSTSDILMDVDTDADTHTHTPLCANSSIDTCSGEENTGRGAIGTGMEVCKNK